MKRLLFFFGLLALTTVFNACTKEKEPDPAVVGSWELSRIRFAGYPSPYESYNGDETPDQYYIGNTFTVKNDKTVTGTAKQFGRISDYSGTWDLSGNNFTLKFDDGSTNQLTLDAAKSPNQLLGPAVAGKDTIRNTTTNAVVAILNYTYQFIYEKK